MQKSFFRAKVMLLCKSHALVKKSCFCAKIVLSCKSRALVQNSCSLGKVMLSCKSCALVQKSCTVAYRALVTQLRQAHWVSKTHFFAFLYQLRTEEFLGFWQIASRFAYSITIPQSARRLQWSVTAHCPRCYYQLLSWIWLVIENINIPMHLI